MDIKNRWNEFCSKIFPESLKGKEIEGLELALLDSDTAGIISSFISSNNLDAHQKEILNQCIYDLEKVIVNLNQDSKHYFSELLEIAIATRDAVQ